MSTSYETQEGDQGNVQIQQDKLALWFLVM